MSMFHWYNLFYIEYKLFVLCYFLGYLAGVFSRYTFKIDLLIFFTRQRILKVKKIKFIHSMFTEVKIRKNDCRLKLIVLPLLPGVQVHSRCSTYKKAFLMLLLFSKFGIFFNQKLNNRNNSLNYHEIFCRLTRKFTRNSLRSWCTSGFKIMILHLRIMVFIRFLYQQQG